MATRQEIQIALDLVRFTNIADDLFAHAVLLAKGETKKQKSIVIGEDDAFEDMTVDEIKVALKRQMEGIRGYAERNVRFLNIPDNKVSAKNGLDSLGVDVDVILADNQDRVTKSFSIENNMNAASTQGELNEIANYIETNIPKLKLVREY